jgi:hypothetical protein
MEEMPYLGPGESLLRHAEWFARSLGLGENSAIHECGFELEFLCPAWLSGVSPGYDCAGQRVRVHEKEDQALGLRSGTIMNSSLCGRTPMPALAAIGRS